MFARAVTAGLATCGLAPFVAFADEGSHAVLPVVANLRNGVEHIAILHLPNSVETRAALTLRQLEVFPLELQHASVRDPARISRIARLLEAALPRPSLQEHDYDARWELSFFRRDGKRTIVACDKFGDRGAINGVAIHFTGTPFVTKLAAMLPHFVR